MAEDKDESQEKTQDPTSRRLEKAKEDGKVVQSREMHVFTILTMGVLLMYLMPPLLDDFLKITASFFNFGPELNSGKSPLEAIKAAIYFVVEVVIIFSIPLVIICILTQFIVGGINFSLKSIHFKFEKMNPIKGLGKIFSTKGLVELGKSLLKVFFLGIISYQVLIFYLPDLINISEANLFSALSRLVSFFPILVICLLVALAVIAAIDFTWQKYDYIKSLRMSHQDIKDEYKDTDGQPEVKQKIRKLQMNAAKKTRQENASIDNLDQATAIITNPTHFAIALKYEVGDSAAPVVIAKGKGKNAELIIEKAKKLNIGKMQSPILARALYFTTEIGDEIVSKLYNAVAIALAYIYKINNGEEIEKPEIEIPQDLIFDENGKKNV
ncbi:MAG: flagellar biosynthesis protein FlhB [Alphaproteobacteria bacterium]|nr:flagellar biosynthesis protein FlhB [Alphaproteobacteria bacterium]